MKNPTKVLLTAPPGTGKSTAIRGIVARLLKRGLTLSGFFTEEVLDANGERVGFDLVDVNGTSRAALSRVGYKSAVMVERYGVDLKALSGFLPLVKTDVDVVVIDEIGNMQLASPDFCKFMGSTIDSDVALVGTVHVFPHALTDELKQRSDLTIITVSESNRDELPDSVAKLFSASRL